MGTATTTSVNRLRQAAGLAVAALVCFGVAALGGAVTYPAVGDWYTSLAKPSWTPPGWVFGPVWTVLFACMAVAAWLVWRRAGWENARTALSLFALQLGLNLAWSFLFFGLHRPGAALADVVLLWLAIAATVRAFWRHSPAAGALLLPYLAWVSFAAALNFAIWRMNA
ncbi:MAG TPA: TspO/MBR family protein [Gemmataceae bacterium]